MTEAKTRSILVEHTDGGATIVDGIPASAKITYGPVQPGKPGYGDNNVIRIYTSQNNQLAVFRNVASFRDLSLGVRVREIAIVADSDEYHGPSGSLRKSTVETTGRFVTPPPFE